MVYVNDLGGYEQKYWSLDEILSNNRCLHLDSYPRNKGPLPKQIIEELKLRGWTEKIHQTGLPSIPLVRFLCPPGKVPVDGVQD